MVLARVMPQVRSMHWRQNEIPNSKLQAPEKLQGPSSKIQPSGANNWNLEFRIWSLEFMKVLYLDIFSGISGDMFIGALLDLGVNAHQFEHELEKLQLEGYHLHVSRGQKSGIAGVKF